MSCLDFLTENLIISGGKDCSISLLDLRTNEVSKTWSVHKQGVCGLKANPHTQFSFASGSNDNTVALYDIRREKEVIKKNAHKAAIRGLCWDSERSESLWTGGGADDKTVKRWNVIEMEEKERFYMGAQICEILDCN